MREGLFKPDTCSECGEELTEEEKDYSEDLCFNCKRKIDLDSINELRHPDNLEEYNINI